MKFQDLNQFEIKCFTVISRKRTKFVQRGSYIHTFKGNFISVSFSAIQAVVCCYVVYGNIFSSTLKKKSFTTPGLNLLVPSWKCISYLSTFHTQQNENLWPHFVVASDHSAPFLV